MDKAKPSRFSARTNLIPLWGHTFRYSLLILCLILLHRTTALAVEVDGTVFTDRITPHGTELFLKGAALHRHLKLIKAYAGALYLPPNTPGKNALTDIPKYLVLEYRVPISARDFSYATKECIRKSMDSPSFKALEPKIDALNRLYSDVKPGDRYALCYIPGMGTELALNNTPVGIITGADFAAALFSVWLGKSPIGVAFRDKLLGG
jgi:hypothetical protein